MSRLTRLFSSGIAALALLAAVGPASAVTFDVSLDGSQEVPVGDPTGTGSGTLTLDPVGDTVSWNIAHSNLANPFPSIYPLQLLGFHIHGPGGSPGNNASILVDLGDVSSGTIPNGTLIGVDLAVSSSIIDLILANPNDFYLNLHTTDGFGGIFAGFPGGAIRGQVPEPNTFLLLGLGLAAFAHRRHQRSVR